MTSKQTVANVDALSTGEAYPSTKIRGKVLNFIPPRGFGFIAPEDEPDKEVFFYLTDMVGYEGSEYPIIPKGTPVEFFKVWNARGWRGEQVSQPGGSKLEPVTEDPEKNYNRTVLYTGTVRYFNLRKGSGFITCDAEKIEWQGKTSDSVTVVEPNPDGGASTEKTVANVYFPAEEIVNPKDWKSMRKGDKVQFNVYIDSKGLGAGKIFRTSACKRKRSGDETDVAVKRYKKTPFSITTNNSYLQGNFRGFLQEHFDKLGEKIFVTFDVKEDPETPLRFLSTAKIIGWGDGKITGLGHGPRKKSALQFSALDLIFKLGLITMEEHSKLHPKAFSDGHSKKVIQGNEDVGGNEKVMGDTRANGEDTVTEAQGI